MSDGEGQKACTDNNRQNVQEGWMDGCIDGQMDAWQGGRMMD